MSVVAGVGLHEGMAMLTEPRMTTGPIGARAIGGPAKIDAAILTEGLGRSFGDVVAISDINLHIERGSIVGLLGPNGSGKTTLIRMLSTLLRPTAGRAWVVGFNTQTQAADVRRHIGLTGQFAAVDDFLTGRENIRLMGRLLGMSAKQANDRADELLAGFSLSDAANRQLGTYSGGMRRRLDLALGLTGHPDVVFLDEPTTGLDPRSRFRMWEVIEGLVAEGTTVLLSTQYLEEADRLAERVVILDTGRVVAEGRPAELRAEVGGDVVEITLRDVRDAQRAKKALRQVAVATTDDGSEARILRIPVRTSEVLADVVRLLDQAKVSFSGLTLHEPTLDDVFLSLTGKRADASTDVDGDFT